LLPRKAKQFIAPTAKKLGYTEDLVEDVVMFYWQSVRDALNKPANISVTIADFGTFNVKSWKLDNFMIRHQAIIDNTDPTTYLNYAALKQHENRKEIVAKLIAQFAELNLKKEAVKEKRYGKDKTNLEE